MRAALGPGKLRGRGGVERGALSGARAGTWLVGALLAALVVLPPAAAQAPAPQGPQSGVTLSATFHELDGDLAAWVHAPRALLVQIMLSTPPSAGRAGIEVMAPIPPDARLVPVPEGPTPLLDGESAIWTDLALGPGDRARVAFFLLPADDADGAVIFRQARLEPLVTWSDPEPGEAQAPSLRLNGLWGEQGLRRTVLPTGLTIFTRERPDSPTVSTRAAARAGSRDEDDLTSGGSHWLEHAFFLGTTRRPGDRIDVEISGVGGQSNASTGWESTDYWHLVPAQYFDLALDVLADQLINSTFLEVAFDRERLVVFEELKLRNDTASIRAFDEFIRLVFQESPLRRDPGGTIESVQSIPISTILAYRGLHYTTGNIAIAVSGNIRHDDTVVRIADAFRDLAVGPQHERPFTPEPVQSEPRYLEVGGGNRIAEVRLGWPVPGDEHPDAPALFVLSDLLGTTGRRLTEQVRERRGFGSNVMATYLDFTDAGAMMISVTTQPSVVPLVVEDLLAEIARLREGDVTQEEIDASLRALAGRRALGDESNQAQTGRARVEVAGTLDSFEEYLARLRSVTPEDILRVAEAYLDLENYTLVVVRP